MRRILGNVSSLLLVPALALGVGGCGDGGAPGSDGSAAQDRSSGSVDATEIGLVSRTGAGGTVDEVAAVLQDRTAVAEFAEQFDGAAMRKKIEEAIARADVPQGSVVLAAVVALGCDVPPGVDVSREQDQLLITAEPVAAPKQECLAPVTTVGLVSVDADEL